MYDHLSMDCEHYRHALSARLDGEETGTDPTALSQHLATCPACRHWEADVATVTRAVRVGSADPIPDLTASILAAIGQEPARVRLDPSAVRAGLAAVAAVQLVFAVSTLLFGAGGITGHLARELGSFDLALAVGFLFAAWKPTRAYGMLPVVAALVAALAVTTTIDVVEGRAGALSESSHLLQLMGLALLWVVTRRPLPPGGRRRLAPS